MSENEEEMLTDEDIIRLARTVGSPLPEGYEDELMGKIDELDRKREADMSAELSDEISDDIGDEIEP